MLPLRLLFSSFQNANFQGNLCPFFKDAAAYAAAAAAFFFVLFKMPLLLLWCIHAANDARFDANALWTANDYAAFAVAAAAAAAATASVVNYLAPANVAPSVVNTLGDGDAEAAAGAPAAAAPADAASVVNYLAPVNDVVVALYLSNYSFARRPCVGAW